MLQKFKILKTVLLSSGLGLALALFVGTTVAPVAVHADSSSSQSKSQSQKKAKKAKVTYKRVIKTEVIKFSTTTQTDPTLAQGTTKILTKGVNGKKSVTYKVTYTNGKATKWQALSSKVITKPVTQVKSVGSYVAPAPAPTPAPAVSTPAPSCTNGTYVNSAGNTVCSPETTPSAPAGATAQCGDGSYSFSQSRSGTCSHHGGVATWL